MMDGAIERRNMDQPPILCLDFDGVLHSYVSGWKGARCIPDDPVIDQATGQSAIHWLVGLLGCPENVGIGPRYLDFKIVIHSSRSRYWGGRKAMKRWLIKHGMTRHEVELIGFPLMKPPAYVTIDDRAITFQGIFPNPKDLLGFKPWYQKHLTKGQI